MVIYPTNNAIKNPCRRRQLSRDGDDSPLTPFSTHFDFIPPLLKEENLDDLLFGSDDESANVQQQGKIPSPPAAALEKSSLNTQQNLSQSHHQVTADEVQDTAFRNSDTPSCSASKTNEVNLRSALSDIAQLLGMKELSSSSRQSSEDVDPAALMRLVGKVSHLVGRRDSGHF